VTEALERLMEEDAAADRPFIAALAISKARGGLTIALPVKILWGAQDRFLASEMAELSLGYCPKGQLTLLPETSHWLQHEEPAAVSQALKEFFAMRDLSD
jgi:pimeloyl-ACP methyl ester carboxylesterase